VYYFNPQFLNPEVAGCSNVSRKPDGGEYQDSYLIAPLKADPSKEKIFRAFEDAQKIVSHAPEFNERSRSTGAVTILTCMTKDRIWCAELGDSFAYLFSPKKDGVTAQALHVHRPSRKEAARTFLEEQGNRITALLHGGMARPASSYVDKFFYKGNTIAPDIHEYPLNSTEGSLLGLFSDGIFNRSNDFFAKLCAIKTPVDVGRICKNLKESATQTDLRERTKSLCKVTPESADDITCALIKAGEPSLAIVSDGHGVKGREMADIVTLMLGHRLGELPKGYHNWVKEEKNWVFHSPNAIVRERMKHWLKEKDVMFETNHSTIVIGQKHKEKDLPTLDILFAQELSKPAPFRQVSQDQAIY